MNVESDSIHVTTQAFAAPFEFVWPRLTNPLNFPRYYPHWITEIAPSDREEFLGKDEMGDEFSIRPVLNRDTGAIDFEVTVPGEAPELSRSRLFPLKQEGCVLLHLAVRWEGVSDEFWQNHKVVTDNDLANASAIIGDEFRNA